MVIKMVVEATIEGLTFGLKSSFNGTNWKRPWSIREYNAEFRKIAKSWETEIIISPNVRVFSGTSLTYKFVCSDTNIEIGVATARFFPLMKQLYDATVTSLVSRVRNDALLASFQFPKEVSVPCEQYLLYFVQFLKDAGVEATADLQHNAGNLLFSVTPTSKEVALENISEALAAYLQLPSNPNVSMDVVAVGDIQTQQLIANVQHLQGQMRLINATLQLQDITLQQKDGVIQDQRFVINQQQKILSGQLISASLQSTSIQQGNDDQEEIFGGAVAFTSVEMYGTKVSTAKIFRWAKNLFVQDIKPKLIDSSNQEQT